MERLHLVLIVLLLVAAAAGPVIAASTSAAKVPAQDVDLGWAGRLYLVLLASGFALVVVFGMRKLSGRTLLRQEPALFTPWGALDLVVVAAAYVLVMIFASMVAGTLIARRMPPWVPTFIGVVSALGACTLVLALANRKYGLMLRDLGFRFDRLGFDATAAVVMLLVVLALREPLGALLQYLYTVLHKPVPHQVVIEQLTHEQSPLAVVFMTVAALVVAPLCEETLFRGFLQPLLRRWLGTVPGIVLTAIVFSLLHDPFPSAPVLIFPLALALGYLYHRTQRLAAPVMLHALHNLITLVLVFAVKNQMTG